MLDSSNKVLPIEPLLAQIEGDAYLGDRDTLEALVQLLLSDAVDDLKSDDPAAATQPRVEKAAKILLGRDPNHQPVSGWNAENGGIADWLRAQLSINDEESDQEVIERVLWHWIGQIYDLISGAEDDGPQLRHSVESLIDQAANLLIGLPASMEAELDMQNSTPETKLPAPNPVYPC